MKPPPQLTFRQHVLAVQHVDRSCALDDERSGYSVAAAGNFSLASAAHWLQSAALAGAWRSGMSGNDVSGSQAKIGHVAPWHREPFNVARCDRKACRSLSSDAQNRFHCSSLLVGLNKRIKQLVKCVDLLHGELVGIPKDHQARCHFCAKQLFNGCDCFRHLLCVQAASTNHNAPALAQTFEAD